MKTSEEEKNNCLTVRWTGNPYTTTFFSFHLWCLTDFTSSPHTIPTVLEHNPLQSLAPCRVSVPGAPILQPWDTMSRIKAVLGSVCGRVRSSFGIAQPPQRNHPLSPLHESLHRRAKRDPEAEMLSLQSFLRKGVSLGYVGSI